MMHKSHTECTNIPCDVQLQQESWTTISALKFVTVCAGQIATCHWSCSGLECFGTPLAWRWIIMHARRVLSLVVSLQRSVQSKMITVHIENNSQALSPLWNHQERTEPCLCCRVACVLCADVHMYEGETERTEARKRLHCASSSYLHGHWW